MIHDHNSIFDNAKTCFIRIAPIYFPALFSTKQAFFLLRSLCTESLSPNGILQRFLFRTEQMLNLMSSDAGTVFEKPCHNLIIYQRFDIPRAP